MPDKLGSFLESKADNESINESLIVSAIIYASVVVIINLTLLLISTFSMIKSTITHTKLTKEINEILGSAKWKVKIMDTKEPNACVIGPRVIFITTGLQKMLTKRELIAIMMHEAYHVRDLHVYKNLMYTYPFFYLIVYIILTIGNPILILNVFAFILMIKIARIPYDITIGRKHERDADAYSIRFGYEKEMVSALQKLDLYTQKEMSKNYCGTICKLERKIGETIDEHPSIKKRIEHVLKQKELWDKVKTGKFKLIKNYLMKQFRISPKEAASVEKGV